jgi:hypothetical protein
MFGSSLAQASGPTHHISLIVCLALEISGCGIAFAVETGNKRFNWILRAALSVLAADRAIAAIIAGETTSLCRKSLVLL